VASSIESSPATDSRLALSLRGDAEYEALMQKVEQRWKAFPE
jgi:hypothetical protein